MIPLCFSATSGLTHEVNPLQADAPCYLQNDLQDGAQQFFKGIDRLNVTTIAVKHRI